VLEVKSLVTPTLNVLIPDEYKYTVLLLQPQGNIEADDNGVRNHDHELAYNQYLEFLKDSKETNADLVVTPEYSMPWRVLEKTIKDNNGPDNKKIWALGCESITIRELEEFKENISSFATVIYDEELKDVPSKFISPLTYVFNAPYIENENEIRTVLLIQLKTHPMADDDDFELDRLITGKYIYKFGTDENSLNLISLICADAFDFKDEIADEVYKNTLIIHIQLNKNPRHQTFLRCRDRLFKNEGDNTELLCLNWASNIVVHSNGTPIPWKNIAGSAWYLKSSKFDARDETLCQNHKLGMYYTWLKPHHTHALFLNYNAGTYLLKASKVNHDKVEAVASRRHGPKLTKTCIWDTENKKWNGNEANDGFSEIVNNDSIPQKSIKEIAETNPFVAERILALSAGDIYSDEEWYKVNHLDSCTIDSSEIIKRITFAQDTNADANKFRTRRLKSCVHLWKILTTQDLPANIKDLENNFKFCWSIDSPHQNIISSENEKRATIIYMGENCNDSDIDKIVKYIEHFLHRSALNYIESRLVQQRFHVWYRNENDEIVVYDPKRHVKIDQTDNESPFDILGE
jgi:hypothetical protein